jgi:hypothetical protein
MPQLRGSVTIRGSKVSNKRDVTPERIFDTSHTGSSALRYALSPEGKRYGFVAVELEVPFPALTCVSEPLSVMLTPQRPRQPQLAPPVTPVREDGSPVFQRTGLAESPRAMRQRCVRTYTHPPPPRPSA